MNDLVIFYMAISPLLILLSARGVAVSRECRRIPRLVDIVCAPVGINARDSKWLHALKIFFYWWFGVFFVCWIRGGQVSDDFVSGLIGVLYLTAFHIGSIGQALRTIKFNVYLRPEGVAVREENRLFYKGYELFPGFKGGLNALISSGVVLMVIFISLAILIGMLNGRGD